MPRDMSAGMLAAIASDTLQPAIFVEANFISGPIYVWTGYGTVTWNGHTWLGIGTFGGIQVIEEGSAVEAKGISLTMSGFDSSRLSLVLGEFQLGLPVLVYFGCFSAGALLASPITSWAGRMDAPSIDVSGITASISIACENRLIDMNAPCVRFYTNDSQQLDYPGDRGFEFVNGIQECTIYFGATPNSLNNR